MSEILNTLRAMERTQFMLLLVFLTAYTLCLGGLFDGAGRRAAGMVALLAAGGFAAFTDPWYHGVLLMAAVVGAIGLFVIAVWVITLVLARGSAAADRTAVAAVDEAADSCSRGDGARVEAKVAPSGAPS